MIRIIERILRGIVWIISFALAGLVVYLAYKQFWAQYDSALLIISLVAGGILCSFVCCAFHEAGHILFGLARGFRFNSLRIGFLKVYRRGGRLHATLGEIPDSVAGMTEMIPKTSHNLYARFRCMTSGGLFFSFLFMAGTATALYFYTSLPFVLFAFICSGLPYSFYLFFYNLLPRYSSDLNTDGGVIFGLAKRDSSCMTAVNILTIEGYLFQGLAPSEIDKGLYFGLPQLPEDDWNFIVLTDYRLMYYIDCGDIPSAIMASNRLHELLEYVPKEFRNEILADILFCECSMKEDKTQAKQLYAQLKQYLRGEKTLQSYRISAAYELYVNGDRIAALRELSAAEQKAETCDVKGIRKYERHLIDCIRDGIIPQQNFE